MASLRESYEAEFEELLFVLRPESLLDIGCGEGGFLRRAQDHGIRATGVDANRDRVGKMRDAGLDVHHAGADKLPFHELMFDAAVCERSAHHFPDLATALREAMRVARDLYVFDPWYDETIPSQKSAADLERWMKRVDTAQGHANNGPFSAQDFLAALPVGLGQLSVSVGYRLKLEPASIEEAEVELGKQLEDWPQADSYRRELDDLLSNARRTGLSGTGAMMLSIRRAR